MTKLPKIIKFVLIATLLLPLIYNKWTIYPSHFGKTVFFQIIIACLLVGAYYCLILRQKQYVKLRLLDWFLLLFVGLSLVSSILGVEWNRSFWGDQSRVQGVFTLIHFVIFYIYCNIRCVKKIICKIFLYYVSFIAATNQKIIDPIK